MVVNVEKISQKMKNESLLSIKQYINRMRNPLLYLQKAIF